MANKHGPAVKRTFASRSYAVKKFRERFGPKKVCWIFRELIEGKIKYSVWI